MRVALLLVSVTLTVAGCKGVPMLPFLHTHKIDIQQGNFVSQDMISRLKPGMTRSQVRFLMGTPLIIDPFHSDRWDYVYTFQKAGTLTEQRRIVAIFENDKLARIEGDVVPAKAAAAPSPAAAAPVPVPAPAAGAAPAPAAPVTPAAPVAQEKPASPQ